MRPDDPCLKRMQPPKLNVFELDPGTYEIRRRVYAARAHWDGQQGIWILESGWVRELRLSDGPPPRPWFLLRSAIGPVRPAVELFTLFVKARDRVSG